MKGTFCGVQEFSYLVFCVLLEAFKRTVVVELVTHYHNYLLVRNTYACLRLGRDFRKATWYGLNCMNFLGTYNIKKIENEEVNVFGNGEFVLALTKTNLSGIGEDELCEAKCVYSGVERERRRRLRF